MTNNRVVAIIKTKNIRAEGRINDIPVVLLEFEEADSPVAVPINHCIVQGNNSVSFYLQIGNSPSSTETCSIINAEMEASGGTLSFSADIVICGEDDSIFSDDTEQLLRYTWLGGMAPKTFRIDREIFLKNSYGILPWQRAEVIGALTPIMADQVFRYLLELHRLLSKGQIALFMEHTQQKLKEMLEISYGASYEPFCQGMTERIREVVEDTNWKLLPLELSDMDFRLVGNGRLIDCLRRNWQPALHFCMKDSPDSYSLPVKIGRLDGRWKILA